MKLFKALAGCFLALFLIFSTTACNSSFCTEEETTAIKTELRIMLDNNTGTGGYATPENWLSQTAEEKDKYVDDLLKKTHPNACLTFEEDEDPITGVSISPKTWGQAFGFGFFDGLLSYPFGFLMEKLARAFGLGGWGQLLSIILVTFIIRLFVVIVTWKPTMAQQRMTMLQPEMAKITAKYGNTQDPALKQKQAMETMALYKKYKINPLSTLLVPFLTLPIFIGVYGAVRAVLVLKEDAVLGLNLGQTLSSGILSFNGLAIAIFLIMIILQFLTMKLPELLNKDQYAKMDAKTRKASKQNQTFTYVMLIMVVVIGWSLPASVSVYWVASSAFSCIQTLLSKKLMNKEKRKEKEERVY